MDDAVFLAATAGSLSLAGISFVAVNIFDSVRALQHPTPTPTPALKSLARCRNANNKCCVTFSISPHLIGLCLGSALGRQDRED